MVNSYLTVGVEGGLPVLACVLCGCALALFVGIRGAMPCIGGNQGCSSWLSPVATASWLAWLVCLLFSNLWIIPWLWAVPVLTLICLGCVAARRIGLRDMRQGLVVAAALAVTVCGGLWIFGMRLESAAPVAITRAADGLVTLAPRHAPADAPRLVVLPDAQVLGESYGQELRRWVLADPHPLRLLVIVSPTAVLPVGETVAAFGVACSDARLDGRLTVRIHPTQSPEEKGKVVKGSILQLPGIDVSQKNAEWEAWAGQRSVTVEQSWGLATDVRARWPGLMLELWPKAKLR